MATQTILDSTREALDRVQQFDVATLSREDELGKQMNFSEAVSPSQALVDIYRRIPLTALDDFSDGQLNTIGQQAKADFNVFKQILEFNATTADAANTRTSIITTLKTRRDQLFDQLWQYVAYGVARITDTTLLETQARATIQSIKDQSEKLTSQLLAAKTDADNALSEIRAVAAEQGVSQQAIHFKQEAEAQETLAARWLTYTYWFAGAVGGFAVLSLFLHKIDWIRPETTAEMFQLISSKLLIFAVLGYLLLMASRNYSTHKHNAVVNRHRQNALLTYRSLVEASSGAGTEDIVLAHAASCIFSPQETGFSHGKGDAVSGSKSVLELLTKSASKE
ncbi:MAG: hypothetical protein KA361_00850 [Chromatiaceae bacterium]|nr:hypothetical protein [Chromatiaceae bacterium]MBP9603004.1 hypothetical protein [Chromatiaceae bacterium]